MNTPTIQITKLKPAMIGEIIGDLLDVLHSTEPAPEEGLREIQEQIEALWEELLSSHHPVTALEHVVKHFR